MMAAEDLEPLSSLKVLSPRDYILNLHAGIRVSLKPNSQSEHHPPITHFPGRPNQDEYLPSYHEPLHPISPAGN